MEIKYTTDGKKVAVLGKLNSTESIVQEIFMVNDQEIPSGENFVVKSLHDAPAISWKENEIKRIKEINDRLLSNLESKNKQYERQLNDIRQKFKEQSKILSDKFKFIAAAVKNADESSFNTLLAFLEGKIKYLIKGGTYNPEIIPFKVMVEKYSDSDYWSGINLISLFGKDDGTFQYRVFDYYDGYNRHEAIIPFENEEDAVKKLGEIISSLAEYNEYHLISAKKHGIKLDAEKVNKYVLNTTYYLKKQHEQYIKDAERTKELIEKIENQIN